jgi:hypothetical protein
MNGWIWHTRTPNKVSIRMPKGSTEAGAAFGSSYGANEKAERPVLTDEIRPA